METDVKKQVEKVPETAAPKLATPENEVKPAPVQQKQVEKPAPIQQKQVEKIEQTTPAVQQIPSSRASVVSNIRFPLMKANIPTQAIKSPAEPQRILYSDLKIRNLPTTPFKAIFLEGEVIVKFSLLISV